MDDAAVQPGRRERKRRALRDHIAGIATRLFLERGFENVTVAEVARAADVAEKTVYNHFPTKEDLFFDRDQEIGDAWVAAVGDHDPSEGPLAGLRRRTKRALGHGPSYAFRLAIQRSPHLSARELRMTAGWTDRMAAALRLDLGLPATDTTCTLIAHEVLMLDTLVDRMHERWRDEGLTGSELDARLGTLIDRAYDIFEHGLVSSGARSGISVE